MDLWRGGLWVAVGDAAYRWPGLPRDVPPTVLSEAQRQVKELGLYSEGTLYWEWWKARGLDKWTVDPRRLEHVLNAYAQLSAKHGDWILWWAYQEDPPDRSQLHVDLVHLLTRFGPITTSSWFQDPVVDLSGFHRDVWNIGRGWSSAVSARTKSDRSAAADAVLRDVEPILNELRPSFGYREQGVQVQVRPTTLRAALWVRVLNALKTLPQPKPCLFPGCTVDVIVPTAHRGRPPNYCTQHRTGRARKQAERLLRTQELPWQFADTMYFESELNA